MAAAAAAAGVPVTSSAHHDVGPALAAVLVQVLLVALADHEDVTGNWFQFNFVEAADRLMPDNTTEVGLSASVRLAGVDTVVFLTGLVLRTIFIAFTLALGTLDPGIAKRSCRAFAGETAVCIGNALSSRPTGVGVTWVGGLHTNLVLADEASLAVRVPSTLGATTSDGVWLGDQLSQAPADGVAKLVCHAHGSGSTWGWVAWVGLLNAPLVLADVAPLTVWVTDALGSTASNGVRLGHKSRLTSADGVSKVVDHASGSRATRRWVAGIWPLNTSLVLANITTFTVWVSDTFWATASDGIRLRHQTF